MNSWNSNSKKQSVFISQGNEKEKEIKVDRKDVSH